MSKEQQELLDEAYKNYCTEYENSTHLIGTGLLWMTKETKDTFVYRGKIDSEFSERWGLKIEERELSLFEKTTLYSTKTGQKDWKERVETTIGNLGEEILNKEFEKHNIPTKLITITYNDKTIESYE